ncbi:MAG TPA: hypothetical protein VFK06_04050 [Candidatus Angelobacter sp.]|nr:hypothetical protein [Candidatus Angelobacter sp.]
MSQKVIDYTEANQQGAGNEWRLSLKVAHSPDEDNEYRQQGQVEQIVASVNRKTL